MVNETLNDCRKAFDHWYFYDRQGNQDIREIAFAAWQAALNTRSQPSEIRAINYDALQFAYAVAKGDNADVREIIEAYLGALPKRESVFQRACENIVAMHEQELSKWACENEAEYFLGLEENFYNIAKNALSSIEDEAKS